MMLQELFEADEIMVTGRNNWKILELKLDEGQQFTENQQNRND